MLQLLGHVLVQLHVLEHVHEPAPATLQGLQLVQRLPPVCLGQPEQQRGQQGLNVAKKLVMLLHVLQQQLQLGPEPVHELGHGHGLVHEHVQQLQLGPEPALGPELGPEPELGLEPELELVLGPVLGLAPVLELGLGPGQQLVLVLGPGLVLEQQPALELPEQLLPSQLQPLPEPVAEQLELLVQHEQPVQPDLPSELAVLGWVDLHGLVEDLHEQAAYAQVACGHKVPVDDSVASEVEGRVEDLEGALVEVEVRVVAFQGLLVHRVVHQEVRHDHASVAWVVYPAARGTDAVPATQLNLVEDQEVIGHLIPVEVVVTRLHVHCCRRETLPDFLAAFS